jgi:hypothetical protein
MNNDAAAEPTGTYARDMPAMRHSMLAMWHLLSLDAPCVAALWTVFIARVFRVALPWTAPLALAVAVWMLYVVDRLADAAAGKAFEERHHFHQRHSGAFAVCWLACTPLLLMLVLHLPHALRDGWLLLAIPLAAYVGAVHALRLGHVPKEPLIGLFFGMAVAMPVISSGVLPDSLPAAIAMFALLCWLNCAAISAWESSGSGHLDSLTEWLGRNFLFASAIAMVASLCVALQRGPSRWTGVAVAASLVLLLSLHLLRGRMSSTHVRALADAALLTPLVVLSLLAWHLR